MVKGMHDTSNKSNIGTHLRHDGNQNFKKHDNSKKTASGSGKGVIMRPLGPAFMPGSTDVICARGGAAYGHPGNCRFRAVIEMYIKQYSEATSKKEKSTIVSAIVASVREATPRGHFIKKERGEWNDVGDGAAREKVGQSLRDALHTMYRSSSKAKQHRLKVKEAMAKNDSKSNTVPCYPGGFPDIDRRGHPLAQSSSSKENSVLSMNSKESSSVISGNQVTDILPPNPNFVPSSLENYGFGELLPLYGGDDCTSGLHIQHDDLKAIIPPSIKDSLQFGNDQEDADHFFPLHAFSNPLPCPSEPQLVDKSTTNITASSASALDAIEATASKATAKASAIAVEPSGDAPGILSMGTETFDELFENDEHIKE